MPHGQQEYGTPVDAANCINEIVTNYTNIHSIAIGGHPHRQLRGLSESANRGLVAEKTDTSQPPLVYITSDSHSAAAQIYEETNWPYKFISRKSCHVDYDKSYKCLKHTVSNWMMLALSDIIVVQTNKWRWPVSGFSIHSAIYGLRGNSIRESKNCGISHTRFEFSFMQMGNWYCTTKNFYRRLKAGLI